MVDYEIISEFVETKGITAKMPLEQPNPSFRTNKDLISIIVVVLALAIALVVIKEKEKDRNGLVLGTHE